MPWPPAITITLPECRTRAFSSEVDTGSREENASKQRPRAPFRFYRNGKGSTMTGDCTIDPLGQETNIAACADRFGFSRTAPFTRMSARKINVPSMPDRGRPAGRMRRPIHRYSASPALCLSLFLVFTPFAAHAQQMGKVSGLPLPRFVSLKSDRVNLREGPSKDNRTTWVFERAGLPVEVTAEFNTWRKVRD